MSLLYLSQPAHHLAKSKLVDHFSRFGIYEAFGDVEAMACAQKSLQLFVPFFRRCSVSGKRPYSFFSRKIFGSGKFTLRHVLFCRNGVAFTNATGAQVLVEAALAITATNETAAARLGKLGIVNIADFCKLFDQVGDIGSRLAIPSALADLAVQVSAKPGLSRRVFANIMQRQAAQTVVIQRR